MLIPLTQINIAMLVHHSVKYRKANTLTFKMVLKKFTKHLLVVLLKDVKQHLL